MNDNDYCYKNFTILVNNIPAIPISYDWRIVQENIQCPLNNEDGLCNDILELFGSQLYVREFYHATAKWKKAFHPGFSIDSVESNGDITCKTFDKETKMWSEENKKYKLKWIPTDFSLNSYCRNLTIE